MDDAPSVLALADEALRGHARSSGRACGLREAHALLAELLREGIETEDGDGSAVRRGTSTDWIASTTDAETRYGHTGHAQGIDGQKAPPAAPACKSSTSAST